MPMLVLLRHGQSRWNLDNRFTGWVDVDLTGEGEAQARRAGELIREEGLHLEVAFTSVLTRAIRPATSRSTPRARASCRWSRTGG